MKKIKHIIRDVLFYILSRTSMYLYVSVRYRYAKGYWMDWKNPQDINEKIQWLKFYGDTSLWPRLADKFAVREYVKEKGLEDTLIPLIGKWDTTLDIDWDKLPEKFVMKVNHGSGDVMICNDKKNEDFSLWVLKINKLLSQKFGRNMGEPHYDLIKPCVIAEQLLDAQNQSSVSSSIIDYKIWCFDGKPAYIYTCFNRTKDSCEVGLYDVDWNCHPEYIAKNSHYIASKTILNKPGKLQDMLQIASVLTKELPVVRCDLYETNNQVYFGEMTLTPASGLNFSYTQEFLNILGGLCKIR